MLLLAFGQPEFDFGMAPLGEIDAERDEREPLLLRLAEEPIDLLAVEEQFPSTEGFVIHDVTVAVGTDVAVVEKDLAALHAGVTILKVYAPVTKGFDLRTLEHDARLELLFNEIVVVGLAVGSDSFFVLFFSLLHHQAASLRESQSCQVLTRIIHTCIMWA